MKLGTSLEKWHKNCSFETQFMEDGVPAHLVVLMKQWHQRHSVKGQTLLRLAQKQPRSKCDWIAVVPIEAMAKSRMCNMNSRTKENHTKVWRKIISSYLQLQCESMLRRMRAFEKVKEGKTKYQDCYGHVNCIILSIKHSLINNAINFFPR